MIEAESNFNATLIAHDLSFNTVISDITTNYQQND